MVPKRGQPPKPPEEKRDVVKRVLYTRDEIEILEAAFALSGKQRSFSRWLATITMEEARRIIESHKK